MFGGAVLSCERKAAVPAKFAATEPGDKADRRAAWEFREHLKAAPYRIHTILTYDGNPFAEPARNRNTARSGQMRFDMTYIPHQCRRIALPLMCRGDVNLLPSDIPFKDIEEGSRSLHGWSWRLDMLRLPGTGDVSAALSPGLPCLSGALASIIARSKA